MRPGIRFGLIVGVVGLLVNTAISALLGLCGPLIALTAGALAGILTARAEAPPTQTDGARAGTIAGLIAGGLILIGQMIGGLLALTLIKSMGMPSILGVATPDFSDPVQVAGYYGSGVGVGVCLGLLGAMLSAAAGAAAAYLTTPSQPGLPPGM